MNLDKIKESLHSKGRYKIGYGATYETYKEAFLEVLKTSFFVFLLFFIWTAISSGGWIFLIMAGAYKYMLFATAAFLLILSLACLLYKNVWFYRLRVRFLMGIILTAIFYAALTHYCGNVQCYI